jgi:hypothetical protein
MVRQFPLTQHFTMNGCCASASVPTMIKANAAASNMIFHMTFPSVTNWESTNMVMFLFETAYPVKSRR